MHKIRIYLAKGGLVDVMVVENDLHVGKHRLFLKETSYQFGGTTVNLSVSVYYNDDLPRNLHFPQLGGDVVVCAHRSVKGDKRQREEEVDHDTIVNPDQMCDLITSFLAKEKLHQDLDDAGSLHTCESQTIVHEYQNALNAFEAIDLIAPSSANVWS